MLKIFTSEKLANDAGFVVKRDIDVMFRLRSDDICEKYKDPISEFILSRIEGMTDRNGASITGKFGPVPLEYISTGGKGCLLAVNYSDFIIDGTLLGKNCLELLLELAENRDIAIVYYEPLYIFDDKTVLIDGELLAGYDASRYLEDNYCLESEYIGYEED